ncbi:MAG: ROK family transcriptional regulator [Oscillospiraceae bacterium]
MIFDNFYDDNEASGSRNSIYKLIFNRQKISKPEIAHILKLSLPTVIQNVKDLISEGLLYENGVLESNGGRKAVAISCEPNARFSVGLDVTRKRINAVLINLKGEIINETRITRTFENTQEYYHVLGDAVKSISGSYFDKILGVGISMPGLMSEDNLTLEYSHVLRISNEKCVNIAAFVPYNAILCNDANAAGIAELWVNENIKDAVYLSVSNSIGGAVFINGRLYRGQNQRSGEVGHLTLVKDGKLCYCEKSGCFDAYCSINALLGDEDDNLNEFFAALRSGSSKHKAKWDEYIDNLSVGINNIRMLFDGDVIIGGYLGTHIGEYIDLLRDKAAVLNTFENSGAYIKPCCFSTASAAVGAALVFVHEYINKI